jgi:hypothetical protein
MFNGRRDREVLGHRAVALLFAELRVAETVEYVGVRMYFSIPVNRTYRERHTCTGGDGHAVGGRERTDGDARHPHFIGSAGT